MKLGFGYITDKITVPLPNWHHRKAIGWKGLMRETGQQIQRGFTFTRKFFSRDRGWFLRRSIWGGEDNWRVALSGLGVKGDWLLSGVRGGQQVQICFPAPFFPVAKKPGQEGGANPLFYVQVLLWEEKWKQNFSVPGRDREQSTRNRAETCCCWRKDRGKPLKLPTPRRAAGIQIGSRIIFRDLIFRDI